MSKIDFKKEYKELYNPKKGKFVIVDVPQLSFLMIDGKGNPNTSQEYQSAVEALYAVAYGLKMAPKKGIKIKGYYEYVVPPLQGLWFAKDMSEFSAERKEEWLWTMMIMQPEFVNKNIAKEAIERVMQKKDNPSIAKVRLEKYMEGLSVQTMYTGAYKDEGPTIQSLHNFAIEQGYQLRGKHHEIYLSNPQKVEPGKLKTVIRQPISK